MDVVEAFQDGFVSSLTAHTTSKARWETADS
jgi:hypothetical protein